MTAVTVIARVMFTLHGHTVNSVSFKLNQIIKRPLAFVKKMSFTLTLVNEKLIEHCLTNVVCNILLVRK